MLPVRFPVLRGKDRITTSGVGNRLSGGIVAKGSTLGQDGALSACSALFGDWPPIGEDSPRGENFSFSAESSQPQMRGSPGGALPTISLQGASVAEVDSLRACEAQEDRIDFPSFHPSCRNVSDHGFLH